MSVILRKGQHVDALNGLQRQIGACAWSRTCKFTFLKMGRSEFPVLVVPKSGISKWVDVDGNGTTKDWAKRTVRSAYLESENCRRKGCIGSSVLLNDFDVFIFDCDGVLWHGDALLPGIQEMLNQIQQMPRLSCQEKLRYKRVLFLTNNSTLSRSGFVGKLARLGINATEEQASVPFTVTGWFNMWTLQFVVRKARCHECSRKAVCTTGIAGVVYELCNCEIHT